MSGKFRLGQDKTILFTICQIKPGHIR